jgi:rhamnogalacturonan hydrolase
VKSPSTNILIEFIYCNLSGGTAIGSLGGNTSVKNIVYKHLYMNSADACFIKTNDGSGEVANIIWDTVIVHGGPYPLTINSHWGDAGSGSGVLIHNLTFKVRFDLSYLVISFGLL